ncbi:hypothetical protein PHISP_02764 [Aspergillus sp. HF37]|nr:hypothetical protein PHISP_02764 [Aspergillus sp. HF37]
MTREEVVRYIDFRHITDATTPDEAVQLLRERQVGKAERMAEVQRNRAVSVYNTSAGWLGYSQEKMQVLLPRNLTDGFNYFKLKVGRSVEEERKRLHIAREVIGYDKGNVIMVDDNQIWSVPGAIEYMRPLAEFRPWFIEEPTSPDQVLGHAAVRKSLRG